MRVYHPMGESPATARSAVGGRSARELCVRTASRTLMEVPCAGDSGRRELANCCCKCSLVLRALRVPYVRCYCWYLAPRPHWRQSQPRSAIPNAPANRHFHQTSEVNVQQSPPSLHATKRVGSQNARKPPIRCGRRPCPPASPLKLTCLGTTLPWVTRVASIVRSMGRDVLSARLVRQARWLLSRRS